MTWLTERVPNPTLTITEIAPDDESAFQAWFAIAEAARAVDLPGDPPACRVAHRASLAPWPTT